MIYVVPGEAAFAGVRVVAPARGRRGGAPLVVVHEEAVLDAAGFHDLVLALPAQERGPVLAGTGGLAGPVQALLRGSPANLAVLLDGAGVRARRDPVEGDLGVVRQAGEFVGRAGGLSQAEGLGVAGPRFPAVGPLVASLRLEKLERRCTVRRMCQILIEMVPTFDNFFRIFYRSEKRYEYKL